MLFYHKGLRGRKTPLPFVACARKAAILRGQIWSAHESDVVGLKDRKYSHKKVEELSSFAETATPPEAQQARLTQNPLFTTLVAVLIALVVNSIINSFPWQNGTKAPILNLGFMLLGIVIVGHSFWSPIANRAKNQHQIIQRFLKWAARDLKEEQFS
jgi:Na+/glutamate symporter